MPLIVLLLFMLASYYMTGIMDDRISLFSKFYKPTITFLRQYGILMIGFCTPMTVKDWNNFFRLLNKVVIVLTFYGLLTLLIGEDPVSMMVADAIGIRHQGFFPVSSARVRICSFMFDSFLYGFFNCVICVLYTYLYFKRGLSSLERVALLCGVASVLLSGSRSMLAGMMIGVAVIVLWGLKSSRIATVALLAVISVPLLLQVPSVRGKISFFTDVVELDGGNTGGSSLDMREIQLEISLAYYEKKPIWGNGFDYYAEVLKSDEILIRKEGLYGAESYLFHLLIDRGLVEIILITSYVLLSLLYMFVVLRPRYKLESSLAASLYVTFIAVSLMTGNYGMWIFCMPLIGIMYNQYNVKALAMMRAENGYKTTFKIDTITSI